MDMPNLTRFNTYPAQPHSNGVLRPASTKQGAAQVKLFIKFIPLLFALVGCTTAQIEAMDNAAGMGTLTSERDAFDGAQRIRLSPANVAKPPGGSGLAWTAGFTVGAQWRENDPEVISLILQIEDDIEGIRGVGVNVRGGITNYETIGLTDIDTNSDKKWVGPVSTAYASIPIDKFIHMINSENVMLRLYTLNGYVDAEFSKLQGRGGALTARHYLQNSFLPELMSAGK